MKILNLLILNIFIIIFTFNCASSSVGGSSSSSKLEVTKKEGFNPNTKRVSTLSTYHLSIKKLNDKSDILFSTYGATVDGKISDIYGEGIVGGEAITNLASKLKLTNFEKAVANLVESELSGVPLNPDTQKTLNTIVEKGKIDAIAVPVISQGSSALTKGNSIDIAIIIYDGRSGKVQVLGQYKQISAKPEDIKLAETQPDQAKANMNVTVLEKTNELLTAMQKEIKGKVELPKKEEVASSQTPKEDKPEEPLKPLDDWLVSKIKFGLGPIVVGFVLVLFLIL